MAEGNSGSLDAQTEKIPTPVLVQHAGPVTVNGAAPDRPIVIQKGSTLALHQNWHDVLITIIAGITIPAVIGVISSIAVIVAANKGAEAASKVGGDQVAATYATAQIDRQAKAYGDFVTLEKQFVTVCYRIRGLLQSYDVSPTDDALARGRTELAASLLEWEKIALALLGNHQVVRLHDSPTLEVSRDALEKNEEKIRKEFDKIGDPTDPNSLQFPLSTQGIQQIGDLVDTEWKDLTIFTDMASQEIHH
ncbi:hypothetical protein [Mycolicibacterium fluoranthenivorans]|uniref:Uncharacterized protein n=1 Tax=Mycolicibacterium fluoranthenivorans TaxID=258505 RepID=A0A1G4WU49_9MYCO|nr:hypothetical protein [Mycolicibacterium fluoranthenivorans]SCX29607.1 hypothetical protein SAMN02799620_04835 [Mycolicibacterium fluoranthenivorans]